MRIIKKGYHRIRLKLTAAYEFFYLLFLDKKNSELYGADNGIDESVNFNSKNEVTISKALRIIVCIVLFCSIFIVWALLFSIDELTKGNGKVIPSSKEQVIQSLDGGILSNIYVKEGEIVKAGDVLAQLDVVRTLSNVEESESRYRALLAQHDRLYAEVNDVKLVFSDELEAYPELKKAEQWLYRSRKEQYQSSIRNITDSRRLINSELTINTRLVKEGASSSVDIIRLKKQLVDLNMKEAELKANYYVKSREEMSKISAEIAALRETVKGRKDLLSKMTIKSPVRGIVKEIVNNSLGGVIPPNGILMQIVPLDDNLVIETQISPRDIAFIHPGQHANVKITAYDYSIYGGLDGEVITISPDTIKDEQKPDVLYYRVYIRTSKDYLVNKKGKKLFISPGMVAAVDIKTGSKTVAQYLMKPFNKVNEALTER